jgi:nicotinate-nucleotide adenylyltransferase
VVTWASSNPFKQHGAPLELRAALLQALVEHLANPRLRLEQQLSSPRAIETLARAQELWPGLETVFVVGSDLVTQIPRWYQAQQLLGECRLAVVPRQGWALQEADLDRLRQLGARVELLPLAVPASASSQFRHHPSPELVPPALWPELVKHRLYGSGHLDDASPEPWDASPGTLSLESSTQPPTEQPLGAPLQPSPLP